MMIASLPLIFEYHYTPELEEVVFNKWFLIGLTLFSTYALNAPWSLFSFKFSSLTWKANKHLFVLLSAAIVLISGLGYRAIPLILLVYIVMSLAWKKQWLQQTPL